ncbi:MAG: hypothetical protein LBT55_04730, partial [Clostridiaceae bacterium]|nr:hypothetical protein [Clostridiaceae bacterium]
IDGVLFRKDGKRLVLFPWQSETNSYIVPDGEDLAVEEAVEGAPEDPIVEVDSEDLAVEEAVEVDSEGLVVEKGAPEEF